MLSSLEFHKDFGPLRISTHEIGVNGLSFSSELSKEALNALLFESNDEVFSWRALHDVQVEFSLLRENDHCFVVRVLATILLSSACVRCLNPVEKTLSMNFSMRMLEREHLASKSYEPHNLQFDTSELDFFDEDSSVGYFSEKCIDLGLILRDQIFLEVPDYPHCAGNTKTASCGTALPLSKDIEGKEANNPFARMFKKN